MVEALPFKGREKSWAPLEGEGEKLGLEGEGEKLGRGWGSG
jgi:hypothetical protein